MNPHTSYTNPPSRQARRRTRRHAAPSLPQLAFVCRPTPRPTRASLIATLEHPNWFQLARRGSRQGYVIAQSPVAAEAPWLALFSHHFASLSRLSHLSCLSWPSSPWGACEDRRRRGSLTYCRPLPELSKRKQSGDKERVSTRARGRREGVGQR